MAREAGVAPAAGVQAAAAKARVSLVREAGVAADRQEAAAVAQDAAAVWEAAAAVGSEVDSMAVQAAE